MQIITFQVKDYTNTFYGLKLFKYFILHIYKQNAHAI